MNNAIKSFGSKEESEVAVSSYYHIRGWWVILG